MYNSRSLHKGLTGPVENTVFSPNNSDNKTDERCNGLYKGSVDELYTSPQKGIGKPNKQSFKQNSLSTNFLHVYSVFHPQ
jgi:hypothetical protein